MKCYFVEPTASWRCFDDKRLQYWAAVCGCGWNTAFVYSNRRAAHFSYNRHVTSRPRVVTAPIDPTGGFL